MRTDYSLIFQDTDAVAKYENVVYAPGSYSSAINARQRRFLRTLVATEFDRPPVHHDFACGTGRVLDMVADLVAEAHGYDVAAAMLDAAGRNGSEAELHLVPAEGSPPRPVPAARPALVTAFRLLLNVTDEVRDRAMAFAAAALPDPDAGLLVVENHGRRESLRHLSARRHRDDPWYAELSDADVAELLRRHGFEIIGRYGFALAGRGLYKLGPVRAVVRRLDDLLAGPLTRFAADVVYVARRMPCAER